MNRFVFDCEADGLLDTVSKVHCISFQDLDSDEVVTYEGQDRRNIGNMFAGAGLICGHNICGYDIPLLEQFYGIDCSMTIFDTLVMSQLFRPDRQLPPGCPTSTPNPVTGKKDTIGPHSLYAWTFKVDGKKPHIYDWRDQPLEVYIDRCEEDVRTTKKVFEYLLREYNSYEN